jgi:hypothetical protein
MDRPSVWERRHSGHDDLSNGRHEASLEGGHVMVELVRAMCPQCADAGLARLRPDQKPGPRPNERGSSKAPAATGVARQLRVANSDLGGNRRSV